MIQQEKAMDSLNNSDDDKIKEKEVELLKKIDLVKNKIKKPSEGLKKKYSSTIIYNIVVELLSSIIVGCLLGLFLDNLLLTKPLLLIICLVLSILAAFRLIWTKYL
jgi:F0F1-type ATP synthase assembly protein I